MQRMTTGRVSDLTLRLDEAAALLATHPTRAVLSLRRHPVLLAALRASQRRREPDAQYGAAVREAAAQALAAIQRRTPDVVAAHHRAELRRELDAFDQARRARATLAAAS